MKIPRFFKLGAYPPDSGQAKLQAFFYALLFGVLIWLIQGCAEIQEYEKVKYEKEKDFGFKTYQHEIYRENGQIHIKSKRIIEEEKGED